MSETAGVKILGSDEEVIMPLKRLPNGKLGIMSMMDIKSELDEIKEKMDLEAEYSRKILHEIEDYLINLCDKLDIPMPVAL